MYSPVKIQQNVFVFCTLNCFYTTVRIFIKNPQINTIARQVYVFRMSDVSGALSLVRYLRYFYYFFLFLRIIFLAVEDAVSRTIGSDNFLYVGSFHARPSSHIKKSRFEILRTCADHPLVNTFHYE